jgi:hypothetical protein
MNVAHNNGNVIRGGFGSAFRRRDTKNVFVIVREGSQRSEGRKNGHIFFADKGAKVTGNHFCGGVGGIDQPLVTESNEF